MALILLDGLADTLCLVMMLRLTGRRIRPLRVLLAAVFGAFAAQGMRVIGFARPQALFFWLPTAYAMAGIAGGRWRFGAMLVLLACEGLLGGTVQAIAGATGSLHAAWAFGAIAVGAMALGTRRARQAACEVHMVRVHVTYGGRTAAFDAMVDSGNSLRDYLTHRPVIVMPDAARGQLGLRGVLLRPIFADTAGGRQMMGCFTPQRTLVEMGGRRLEVCACVALSPGLGEDAPALVPQSLLDKGNGEISDIEGDAYGKAKG